jgi:hypothetical protein
VQATVTVEMESRYGWYSDISDTLCISSIASGMMVLEYENICNNDGEYNTI